MKRKEFFKRFKELKRGYYSFIIILFLLVLSLGAEMITNNRALIVKYNDNYYFPIYSNVYSGIFFGEDYNYEADYKSLKESFKENDDGSWLIMPIVPYGPYESDLEPRVFVPTSPDFSKKHFLGTDSAGRDILSRLIYGFRLAFLFSLALIFFQFVIGIAFGTLMAYRGKFTDLIGQRLLEVWSSIPTLYVIMIMAAVFSPGFWTLLFIMAIFSWMGMTELIRTSVYKEKNQDYVLAARAIGASHSRIIFHHILPNTIAVIITFLPFSLAGGITALTSLDYLGFGLPPPSPSWGELLQQGTERLDKPWIILSTVGALSVVLVLVTFVGEAIREAFDPKKHILYK